MQTQVKINNAQIDKIGSVISELKVNPTFYKRKFLTYRTDKDILLGMYFFSVAICHQTHTLHNKELNLWGWDYLEYGFLEMAKNNSPLLSPKYLETTESSLLKNQLAKYFAEDFIAGNTTLDRLDERVELMKDAAKIINKKYNGSLTNLFEKQNYYLIKQNQGLYEMLESFKAFSDPKRKKSTFLIKLLKEADLVKVIDTENYIPIMDYHMQRVLLRSACVEIADEELKDKLKNRVELSSDEPIRSACIDALKQIALKSKKDITKMNDFFWSMGRSCCNETTLCRDKKCLKQPCTFQTIVDLDSHAECVFAEYCPGSSDDNYRNLWEPIVKTHYY